MSTPLPTMPGQRRGSILEVVLLALPALTLGLAGLAHPSGLNPDTAFRWYAVHLPGLLVFPLVGAAVAWHVRGVPGPLAWVVRLAAYGYATFYSALDIISGIAAGFVTDRLGADAVPRPKAVSLLFRIGTPLGDIGSWSLLVAVLALGVLVVRRDLRALAPLVALVLGAWFLRSQHIFPGGGTLDCLALAVGTAGLAWTRGREDSHAAGTRGRVPQSPA